MPHKRLFFTFEL